MKSYGVGWKHRSAATNIYNDIISEISKKTIG